MATTLLERLSGNVYTLLGRWELDEAWTRTNSKLADLTASRAPLVETLIGAREAHKSAVIAQKRSAAAVLVGDESDKDARTAERVAKAAEARITQLEADLEALDSATQTLQGRLLDL